jgi:DNA-binding CsgD family transcriptional regulator
MVDPPVYSIIGGSATEAAAHVTKGAEPQPRAESERVRTHSPAQRPAFGWGSLTEAELRVARLAANGLTNRAIADELSLSPHTVESHLRHAFHKLDLRSRVELTTPFVGPLFPGVSPIIGPDIPSDCLPRYDDLGRRHLPIPRRNRPGSWDSRQDHRRRPLAVGIRDR